MQSPQQQKDELAAADLLKKINKTTASHPGNLNNLESLIGKEVEGKYIILSLIGSSATSSVYLVKHKALNKVMALKMIHPHLALDQKTVLRFQREAQAASKLEHPNIICIHDFGLTFNGNPYFVMDYVQGTNLGHLIERNQKLEPQRAVHIVSQVCSALEHAHENGIVHRDLKPGNIMVLNTELDPDFVKIVDFGIAKLLLEDDINAQKLTHTGEVFGTPLYMSPEQCLGQKLDARTDIYSLGCVLYECLTGKQPLIGDTAYETISKQINEMPAGLGNVIGDSRLKEALEIVVFGALAKDRNKRYKSMASLKEDLDLIARGRSKNLFVRLANIWYLQQLKRGPLHKKIPMRLAVTVVILLFALIGTFSWFLGKALSPEHENYYQSILWNKNQLPSHLPTPTNDAEIGKRVRKQVLRLAMTAKPSEANQNIPANPTAEQGRLVRFTNIVFRDFAQIDVNDPRTTALLQTFGDDLWRDGYYQMASLVYPEAVSGLSHYKSNKEALNMAEQDLMRMSAYLISQNRWPELEPIHKQLLKIGTEPDKSATNMDKLCFLKCQYADVCRHYAQAITNKESVDENGPTAEALMLRAQSLLLQSVESQANQEENKFYHDTLGLPQIGLALLYDQEGKTAEAYQQYKQAYAFIDKSQAGNQKQYTIFLGNYGDFLWRTRHYQEAMAMKLKSAFLKLFRL